MAEESQTPQQTTQPQTSHWWQTMPAMMGGVATLLTAVTGLVVAFKPSEPPQTATPAVTPAAAQVQTPAQNSVQQVQAQPLQAQPPQVAAPIQQVQAQPLQAQPPQTPTSVQTVQQQILSPASSPVEANYSTSNGDDGNRSRKKRRKKEDD